MTNTSIFTFLTQGPIAAWLQREAGPSPVIDLTILAAGAVALFFAALRCGLARPFAAIAALIALTHASALAAIPNAARGELCGSLFSMTAIALAGVAPRAGAEARAWTGVAARAAAAICFAAAQGMGSPVAAAFAIVAGGSALANGTRGFGFVYLTIGAGSLLAWITAASGFDFTAAAAAASQAVLPVAAAPDLYHSAGAFPFIAAFATAALILVNLTKNPTRIFVLFMIAAAAACAAAGARFYLHERASAALAPAAALLWAGALESASAKLPSRALVAAGAAAAALFGWAGIRKFTLARDTDRYLEESTAAAPRSATLLEAHAQVLAARARAAGLKTDERIVILKKAVDEFERAAAVASAERKFIILSTATEAAVLAGDSGRAELLLPRMSEAAWLDEQRGDSAVLRARYLESTGKRDQAAQCVEAAAAQFPTASGLRRYYLKTAAARLALKFTKAKAEKNAANETAALAELDQLEKSLARDLDSSTALTVRASALAARGRIQLARARAVDAMRDFQDAKRADPQLADAYIGAAESYLSQNIVEGAVRELREGLAATQPSPPAELLVSLAAVELQAGGAPEVSLQLVEMARQADPGTRQLNRTLAAARVALAEKRAEKGDLAGAEEALAAAKEEAPDWARIYSVYARIRDEQKRVDEALLNYQKAFELDATDENREKFATSLKNSAVLHLYAKDRPGAIDRFLQFRSLNAKNTDIGVGADILAEDARREYEEGQAALKDKNITNAQKKFERSLELLPNNYYALSQLGALAAEAAETGKAIEYFEKALASAKATQIPLAESAIYYNLAQQYRLDGKLARASEVLKEYLALGTGSLRTKCEALLEIVEALRK